MGVSRGRVLPFYSAAIVVAVGICLAQPAFAYLDPGTGSLILQGLVAAVAAVGIYAGLFWKRIRSFFARGSEESPRKSASTELPPNDDAE